MAGLGKLQELERHMIATDDLALQLQLIELEYPPPRAAPKLELPQNREPEPIPPKAQRAFHVGYADADVANSGNSQVFLPTPD
jgi:hypothetical protein